MSRVEEVRARLRQAVQSKKPANEIHVSGDVFKELRRELLAMPHDERVRLRTVSEDPKIPMVIESIPVFEFDLPDGMMLLITGRHRTVALAN